MKILLLLVILIASCGAGQKQEKHEANPDCVFVCTGGSATRYHSVSDCRGLSRCSDEVIKTTLKEAEEDGRTPCRMCVKQTLSDEDHG